MAKVTQDKPCREVLQDLYEVRGLTAAAIGERYGVEKITALRWLRAAGIERRPAGRGLAHRGIQAPDADELRRLIHDECLGYAVVAEMYGVDPSAVGQWLTKHGIPKPTIWQTRRRGHVATEPTEQELRARVEAGESLRSIATDYEVSNNLLSSRCKQYGIRVRFDGWRDVRLPCRDGHLARSVYELLVDDWLTDHGLDHETEPRYPWDRRYRADFLVGQTYIEVWGVTGYPAYTRRRDLKIRRCREAGLHLIGIGPGSFRPGGAWKRRLSDLLSGEEA